MAVRGSLAASFALVAVVLALEATAAPRMDNVCRSVDARGNVMYGDCPPETTYAPPPPPAVVQDAVPPSTPQSVTNIAPAKVEQAPRRSLSSIWSPAGVSKPAGSTSRKSYPILGVPLLIVGMLVALISSINFVVGAFRVGLGWGLGCLFVAPVSFVYLVMHWKVAKRSFIVNLAGLAAALIGYYVLGAGV